MSIYRTNSLLNIISAVIKIIIQLSLWTALLKSTDLSHGVTFFEIVSFLLINTIVLSLTQTNMGNLLGSKIKEGIIAVDLLRPVNLKLYLFAEEIGENLYRTIFNILPVCLVVILFLKYKLPPDSWMIFLFIISLLNGIIIIYFLNYWFALTAFWFKESWHIGFYQHALLTIFGGTLVPLWFYPESLLKIINFLPFKYVAFQSITIFLGRVSFTEAIHSLLIQIFWIIILYFLGLLTWQQAQKKITVQGG